MNLGPYVILLLTQFRLSNQLTFLVKLLWLQVFDEVSVLIFLNVFGLLFNAVEPAALAKCISFFVVIPALQVADSLKIPEYLEQILFAKHGVLLWILVVSPCVQHAELDNVRDAQEVNEDEHHGLLVVFVTQLFEIVLDPPHFCEEVDSVHVVEELKQWWNQ